MSPELLMEIYVKMLSSCKLYFMYHIYSQNFIILFDNGPVVEIHSGFKMVATNVQELPMTEYFGLDSSLGRQGNNICHHYFFFE